MSWKGSWGLSERVAREMVRGRGQEREFVEVISLCCGSVGELIRTYLGSKSRVGSRAVEAASERGDGLATMGDTHNCFP